MSYGDVKMMLDDNIEMSDDVTEMADDVTGLAVGVIMMLYELR